MKPNNFQLKIRKKLYASLYNFSRKRVLSNRSIWQFCTPKSASTYLNRILNDLWHSKCVFGNAVPSYGQRTQEPDVIKVCSNLLFSRKRYFSGQLHARYTGFVNSDFLGKESHVIVQTRDLKDTLVSMRDHMNKESVYGFHIVSAPSFWSELNEAEQYRLVAYTYVPWHLDFIQSWHRHRDRLDVNYDSLIGQTEDVIKDICRYVGCDVSDEEISFSVSKVQGKQTRKNVGIGGRGKELPSDVSDFVDEMTSFFLKLPHD